MSSTPILAPVYERWQLVITLARGQRANLKGLMMFEPMFGSRLFGDGNYPKQWSEIFELYKKPEKKENKMIKLTKDELINMIKYRIAALSGRVCIPEEDDFFYKTLENCRELKSRIDMLRNVMNSAHGSEFEVSLIGAKDLTVDSEETAKEEVKTDD